jgi:hypothetical protein
MHHQQPHETNVLHALGKVLRNHDLVESLKASGNASSAVLTALAALGEQAVTMGIDYLSLGHGWNHPRTRKQYRDACHPSATCFSSRQRAETSRQRLREAVVSIINGFRVSEDVVVENFLVEIGVSATGLAPRATFAGVAAALAAELLLPLRALNEGQPHMCRTYAGEPIPAGAVRQAVHQLTSATLSKPGGFSEWRYNNSIGKEQLRGLTRKQAELWKEPTSIPHEGGIRTHEDEDGELGFFWATKIGGPSHGFDFEGQCHLPLLANARNKVVLVSDPAWPAHPAARAHFRLLWTAPENGGGIMPEPRLWLEAVNCDFDAATVNKSALTRAVLAHAVEKSEAMGVPLSLYPSVLQELAMVTKERRWQSSTRLIHEKIALRPSNGVCEASDFLTSKHDWVQVQEEVTEPIARALYDPASCKAVGIRQALGCVL